MPADAPATEMEHPALLRNNVHVRGGGAGRPLLFVHGFGCDQNMWRHVAPAFEDNHPTVLLDLTGMGGSDRSQYDRRRHGTLQGHADDLIEVVEALELEDVVFVDHSVSAVIGALAVATRPELFHSIVMVGPNPCYINDDGYVGGFERDQLEGLLDAMEENYLGWSSRMAPVITGNADRPEIGAELTNSFCSNDPSIARHFARVTFLSDHREDLEQVDCPTLVLQCSEDVIAPEVVGRFVHERIPGSEFVKLRATGHTPNLSAPEETVDAMRPFVDRP